MKSHQLVKGPATYGSSVAMSLSSLASICSACLWADRKSPIIDRNSGTSQTQHELAAEMRPTKASPTGSISRNKC